MRFLSSGGDQAWRYGRGTEIFLSEDWGEILF